MAPAQDHEPMDPNSKIMIKGRRTKRPRTPSSPLALSAVSDEGTRSGGVTTSSSSSATSSEYSDRARAASLPATEEEEDMANCLILLAQGGAISIPCSRQQAAATATAQPESSTHQHQKTQSAAAAAGVTVSVYECKTCNRCFPSFQALGGHRAGHKKPKLLLGAPSTTPSEDKRMTSLPLLLGYDHDENPGLSLRIAVATKESKTRAHECTICGSGFVSGQALGGHMRRHRAILGGGGGGGVSPVVVAGGGRGVAHYDPVEEGKKVRTSLPLDLNLPAPDEDQDHNHRDQQNKYVFSTDDNNTLVFSASPMVDCHY